MTAGKDLKRRVRARMKKTGESYTSARAMLVALKQPVSKPVKPAKPSANGPKAGRKKASRSKASAKAEKGNSGIAAKTGMSDAAVSKKTGRIWSEWVDALDGIGAVRMDHRTIASRLANDFGLEGWWAQMVAVGYERIRGLRQKNQDRTGTWDVNKSKVYPVPISELYAAFERPSRKRWLPLDGLTPLTSRKDKSVRWKLSDGTRVEINFWKKGPAKSQAQLQHRLIRSKERAEELRAFWTDRFAALGEHILPS